MKKLETKLYIVLDEHTLNTMKGKGNKTAKFKTFEEADLKAAEKLEIWTVIEVWFEHNWIHHRVKELKALDTI